MRVNDEIDARDRLRRSGNLERTMLALRDAREAHDVLAIVARSLGRDFKRPVVSYEIRDASFRAVASSDAIGVRERLGNRTFDLEALRVRGIVRRGTDDIVGIGTEGQIRAVVVLEGASDPLADEDLKYLRTLAVHVSLALANAQAFEQLRRYAAEGAALTEAARMILNFTEIAPLATSLCRMGVRLVHAEWAAAYVRRDAAFERIASVNAETRMIPQTLPHDLAQARAELNGAFAGASIVVTPIKRGDDAGGERGVILFSRATAFEKSELRLLETLVTLAALAFRNVDLYEEATNSARALAENNAFKDDLMAMFAHDFKGPLTVISGFSELLFDSEDPGVKRTAQTIVEQTRRLAKLSEDALALAATQSTGFSLKRVTEDIAAFVTAVATPLDREGFRIVFEAPPDPVLVSFDRSRLRHVIDNVVGNALKYSSDRVFIGVERRRDRVVVSVADRGIGIPPAEVERIFSRFGRATNARSRGIAGSGVGLYIAKKIVDVHGGELEVRSVENEGSTFSIVLPA